MHPNPQARWSPRTIVMDCLTTTKNMVKRDVSSGLEATTSQVRQAFERMHRRHCEMATELRHIAQNRGWYPQPLMAVSQHEQQVSSTFQPVRYQGQVGDQNVGSQNVASYGQYTQAQFGAAPGAGTATAPFGTQGFQSQYGSQGHYGVQAPYGGQTQYGASPGYYATQGRHGPYGPTGGYAQ